MAAIDFQEKKVEHKLTGFYFSMGFVLITSLMFSVSALIFFFQDFLNSLSLITIAYNILSIYVNVSDSVYLDIHTYYTVVVHI